MVLLGILTIVEYAKIKHHVKIFKVSLLPVLIFVKNSVFIKFFIAIFFFFCHRS